MKAWLIRLSIASAVSFAIACGDDDSPPPDEVHTDPEAGSGNDVGSGNEGGSGNSNNEGGSGNKAGSGNSDNEGGSGDEAGAGSGGAPGLQCEPPARPASGEGGEGGADAGAEIALVGEYEDDFGSDHVITASSWTIGTSVFHISAFDNEAGWAVARNDQGNEWSPCLWSRFDWVETDSKLYLCQTAFDAESEEAALEADAPDASKPTQTGCSGFPWSELIAK